VSTVNEVGQLPGRRPRNRAGAGLSGRETMLLLIPALLPIVILSVIPLVRGIYLGFTDSRAGLAFRPPSSGSTTSAHCSTTSSSSTRSRSA